MKVTIVKRSKKSRTSSKKTKVDGRTTRKQKTDWTDSNYLIAHNLYKSGMTDGGVAAALGVSHHRYSIWMQRHPALKEAKEGALRKKEETFLEYVYQRIPPRLQEHWRRMKNWRRAAKHKNGNTRKQQRAISRESQQHLFLHALVHCNFSVSRACAMCGIAIHVFSNWQKIDSKFVELLDEIDYHKKNFFEEALIKLVKQGVPSAVVFCARTQLRDRGYSEKTTIEHTGDVGHRVSGTIAIQDLDLPTETLEAIVESMRASGQLPILEKYQNLKVLPNSKEIQSAKHVENEAKEETKEENIPATVLRTEDPAK